MKTMTFVLVVVLSAGGALAAPQDPAQIPQPDPEAAGSDPSASPAPPAAAEAPAPAPEAEAAPAPEAEPASAPPPASEAAPDPASDPASEPAPEPDRAAEPKPEAEPESAAPPPPVVDPNAPVARSVPWEDPVEKLAATSTGAVDACETAAFPLTFLPGVGSVASSLIEWVCLIPAALAIDYVGVHHAGYESFLWQPLAALLLAKLWRGFVLVAGWTTIIATGFLFGTVVSAALALGGAAAYIPVGLTGVLTLAGGMIMAMSFLKKRGSEFVFTATYTNLANQLSTPVETLEAQDRAWIKPPPGPFGRAYSLLSAAAGAEPERSWAHGIPVAGPLFRAGAKAEAVEEATLQVGRDVLGERPQYPDELRMAAEIASYTEGVFGAVGQALLGAGAVVFVTGTVLAALSYQANEDLTEYGVVIGGLGGLGVAVAGTGVTLILLREVPRIARSLLVPAAFGLCPPAEETAAE